MLNLDGKSLSDLIQIQVLILNANPKVVNENYNGKDRQDYLAVKGAIDAKYTYLTENCPKHEHEEIVYGPRPEDYMRKADAHGTKKMNKAIKRATAKARIKK